MVLLFCRFVVTSCNIVNQQNNKTTKQQDNKTTRQQNNKSTNQQNQQICLEDSTERSESNPGRSLGTYRQEGSICLEDSTFQHSEKESTDKNKAQKVMLCKSIAITLQ